MTARPWTPARHGPLTEIAGGLWSVEAELDVLPIGRRMVIARAGDGSLAVHSAVACDAPTMAAIEELGPVGWIIVPSGYHRMDAPAWKARYPAARVVTTALSTPRVSRAVSVDGGYELLPAGDLGWELLDGAPAEAVFLHRDRGGVTAIFNDAFMNLPDRIPGFKGWVVKLLGSTGGPKVTRTARVALVRDRAAYAGHLRRLAELPGLTRLIPGHGAIVDRDARSVLRAVADQLHRE